MISLIITRVKLLLTSIFLIASVILSCIVVKSGNVNILSAIGIPVWAAGFALLLYFWGLIIALKAINSYANEEKYINKNECFEILLELAENEISIAKNETSAKSVSKTVNEAFGENKQDMMLLAGRIEGVIQTFRRGAPMLLMDFAEVEDRHFPRSERKLRALMDIVLNIGIAGTFLSLIFTFTGKATSFESSVILLSHIGPGLISGLAGIFANVALRICHTILLNAQDRLAEQVDNVIDECFLSNIPRKYISPVDRLTDVFSNKFGEMLNTLADILTKQLTTVMNKINEQFVVMTEHTGMIAESSSEWGKIAEKLEQGFINFMREQEHTFQQWRSSSDEIRKACDDSITSLNKTATNLLNNQEAESNLMIKQLTETHVEWVKQLLINEKETRKDWIRTQEETTLNLVASATELFSTEAISHFQLVNADFNRLLAGTSETFKDAVHNTLVDATKELTDQINQLRIDTGILAQSLNNMKGYTNSLYDAGNTWKKQSEEQYTNMVNYMDEYASRLSAIITETNQQLALVQGNNIIEYSNIIEKINNDVVSAVSDSIETLSNHERNSLKTYKQLITTIESVYTKSSESINMILKSHNDTATVVQDNVALLKNVNKSIKKTSDDILTVSGDISINVTATAGALTRINNTTGKLLNNESEILEKIILISSNLEQINNDFLLLKNHSNNVNDINN